MRSTCRLLSFAAATLGLLSFGARADAPPTAVAAKTTVAPVIDGDLSDSCWASAWKTDVFRELKDGAVSPNTTLKVARDDRWLYLGLDCRHPKPADLHIQHRERDAFVYADECVEFFIDPGTDGREYYHYIVNAANARYEKKVPTASGVIPWRSATKQTLTGWSAEAAIPLYFLGSYGDLSKSRMNISRNLLVREYDPSGIFRGARQEYSLWSPVVRTSHEPERFGAVQGLENAKIETPFLVVAEAPRVSGFYNLSDGVYYDLSLDIRNLTEKPGRLNVAIIDAPNGEAPRNITRSFAIAGNAEQTLKIPIRVDAPRDRKVSAALSDAATAMPFGTLDVKDTSAFRILCAFFDRNYYTSEPLAKLVYKIGLPVDALKTARLVAQAGSGVLTTLETPPPEGALAIPLNGLPIGKTPVAVSITRDGKALFSETFVLDKKTPKPGKEWKIDRVNGVMLRDGEPYFPFGFVMSDDHGDQDEIEANARALGEAGFNHLIWWVKIGMAEKTAAFSKAIGANGLTYTIWDSTTFGPGVVLKSLEKYFSGTQLKKLQDKYAKGFSASFTYLKADLTCEKDFDTLSRKERLEIYDEFYEKSAPFIAKGIDAFKDDPNLAARFLLDEPLFDRFDEFSVGRKLYNLTNEIDGYHPCVVNYSSHIPAGDEAADWCDILCTDPYWVPRGTNRGDISFIAEITKETVRRASEKHLSNWIVPQASYWGQTHKRPVTPAEQKCQTYLSLINGARGVIYFTYGLISHVALWDALKELAGEVKGMAPALTAPYPPRKIAYAGDGKVQVDLKRFPDGDFLLLAANMAPYPTQMEIRLPGWKGDAATRLFPDREISAANAVIGDELEAFGVRAYRVKNIAKSADGNYEVNVTTRANQGAYVPEAGALTRRGVGRENARNIHWNAGFENDTLKGWPDYYLPTPRISPMIGTPNAGWELVADRPFEGKKCLRLRNGNGVQSGVGGDGEYTLSVYLRANKENVKVWLGMYGYGKTQPIIVDKEWKRYSVTDKNPRGLMVRCDDKSAEIDVDAVQLEKGAAATEFQP